MGTTKQLQTLSTHYAEVLGQYLQDGNEIALTQGYELGRDALMEGLGILDMADIHHKSLRELVAQGRQSDKLLVTAGEFFVECLSPFEMSHRGAEEGRQALRRLNEILETELKRIAHALHDEAGQLLASVHIALAEVASVAPKKIQAKFFDIEQLLMQIEVELRGLSHELRPTILDNLGLVPALEFLAERISKRSGIKIEVEAETNRRLPAAVETALYRIVQEALNNAVKHAHAKMIKIQLCYEKLQVTCRVSDDGAGFEPKGEPTRQGLGLLGIRERLNAIGGTFQVITEPERGTTILAEVPIEG